MAGKTSRKLKCQKSFQKIPSSKPLIRAFQLKSCKGFFFSSPLAETNLENTFFPPKNLVLEVQQSKADHLHTEVKGLRGKQPQAWCKRWVNNPAGQPLSRLTPAPAAHTTLPDPADLRRLPKWTEAQSTRARVWMEGSRNI